EKASAIPGVNAWGNATRDLTVGTVYSTRSGDSNQILINTSLWTYTSGTKYYLYPPQYNCTDVTRTANTFTWDDDTYGGFYVEPTGGVDPLLPEGNTSLIFDRAGMWIFDEYGTDHYGNDTSTFVGYIWVNTSTEYVISAFTDFDYGLNTTKTITVTDSDGNSVDCNIALLYPNGTTAFNSFVYGGVKRFWTNGTILVAGNYTIRAYRDDPSSSRYYTYQDEQQTWPSNTYAAYGPTYGSASGFPSSPSSSADYYNYTNMGPWDPPEINATEIKFRVRPGTPQLSIPTANKTMYWNFTGEVNVSIKDSNGDNLSKTSYHVEVYRSDVNITANLTIDRFNGYCHISPKSGQGWGNDRNGTVYGENGTWTIYVWSDLNGDRTESNKQWTEEWNGTITFKVQRAPGVQFKWIDDDGTYFTGADNDGIIPGIPSVGNVPLNIQFQIIGSDHSYFGGTSQTEAMENITLSGNALFTGTLDKIPGVSYSGGTWTVPVIPTMSAGGGEITIAVTWENYGSISETLDIGGTLYNRNGTVVSVTPSEFVIENNQTLQITVTTSDDTPQAYSWASVYLYYLNDTGVPYTTHLVNSVTYGTNGVYTLEFNTTQQTTNQTNAGFGSIKAPRNLTIYVDGGMAGYGYAKLKMKPKSDLIVTAEAIASPATNTILAGMEYTYFFINVTVDEGDENTTTYPSTDTADLNAMYIKILDEDGNDVTNTVFPTWGRTEILSDLRSSSPAYYVAREPNAYSITPGTYTVFAYNNTHNSEGNNATFYVKQAVVECDKSPFIWMSDANISATFTITSEITGERLNGTLKIENMTWTDGTYNKTWTNTSAGNSTIELDESDGLVNGQITVHNITANYLPPGVYYKNITFWFKPENPDGSLGYYARTLGVVKVRVPFLTITPTHIPVGETTQVKIYVGGRDDDGDGTADPLDNIFVELNGRGIDHQNGTSGDNGIITFSLLPTSTGNISIDVGEVGRTVEDVIKVTDWSLEISAPVQVDEGTAFTVTVTNVTTGLPEEGVYVTVPGIGTETTDANGEATFTWTTELSSDRTVTITAEKSGYKDATPVTITILDVSRLQIAVDETITAGSTFEVVVGTDKGDPVIGATVTVSWNDKTYKTKAGGVAKIDAPKEVKSGETYTITATFGDFEKATATVQVKKGGTPGFELLTLITALGVAFILLRRRRH
ncbi:MAG: hypothetical protein DRM98_02885, partial [Thermoplasmata archaeon]